MKTFSLSIVFGLASIVLAVSLLSARAEAQKSGAAGTLVLQGGTLIDGTGKAPLENAVILIEGDRIKAIGKQGEVAIPKGSRVVSAKGRTVLPGYIDGHCHMVAFQGEIYLNSGIVTCADVVQNHDEWTKAQRDGTALGKIRGPRIWSTGGWVGEPPPSSAQLPDQNFRARVDYLIKTPEDAVAAMRKKKELGLDIVKFNEYVSPELLRAGAAEANRLGLPVTCHCLDVFLAAESGFAGVEHHWAPGMTSIDDVKRRWDIHEQRASGKIDTAELPSLYQEENFDKIVQAMVAKKVSWSPTIATWFRPLSPSVARFKERELSILDNPKAKYLPPGLRELVGAQYARYDSYPPERLEKVRGGYRKIQDLMVRFVKAGGILRASSDPNNGLPGLGLHEEMAMLVEAGLTPMEAIAAGTINVAKGFRKDKDFGSVEVGKVADIVVIDGDPLRDIWALQNVKMMVLGGKVMDIEFHANYKNPIPNVRPYRPTPRDIEISPRSIVQGSGPATLTVTANRGLDRYHRVTLNGKELETHFVSRTELEAVVPPQAIKEGGTYTVEVVGEGDFASRSGPAYLIVPFKK